MWVSGLGFSTAKGLKRIHRGFGLHIPEYQSSQSELAKVPAWQAMFGMLADSKKEDRRFHAPP